MQVTNVSVLRLKEKQEEHRTRQTLFDIQTQSYIHAINVLHR